MAKKSGRPSAYTPELAERICLRLAQGDSLRAICRDDDVPTKSTVLLWVVDDREGFSDQYARARQAQALDYADELLEIADESNRDTYKDEDGKIRTDHEAIQRSKLRVDTRKWVISRILRKVYGDSVALTGADGEGLFSPKPTSDVPDDEVARRAAILGARMNATATGNGTGAGHNGKH